MRATFAICAALSALLPAPSFGAPAAQKPRASKDLPELPFEKYQLANGLTVILHHDARLPLVAVSVWYDVGGLHEKPGKSGFAHLFEHMMFQGTPNVGEDKHFAFLQQAGATLVNGTTDFDRTNYFETVPKNELELALWLESDRMGFLLDSLTQKSLDNQREVVKNERRQSVENQPYGLFGEKIVQAIYPSSHPYYGNVIGSMADLTAASLDDVRDFFRTYYTPANATLTLAGDFDPKTIKATIEKYFGSVKGRDKPKPVEVPAPKIEGEKTLHFEEPVGVLPKITFTWMAPSAFQPDTAELDLVAHVLSGTKSARLDRKLTYEDLVAQSVSASLAERKSGGMFEIDVTVRENRTIEEAQKIVDAVLEDLRKRPPTTTELARAKNAQETNLVRSLEVLGGFGGRAERLQTYNLYLGDPGKLAWDIQRYRKATVADLQRVIQKYLTKDRLVAVAIPAGKKK